MGNKHIDQNLVVIIGRLTRDAELRYSNAGLAISKFSVANSAYQGKDRDTYTNFFECTWFGKAAESLNQYLRKGRQVSIVGELRQDRWEQDGNSRTAVKIIVNNLQLLQKPGDSSSSGGAGSSGGYEGRGSKNDLYNDAHRHDSDFEDDIPF